MNPGCPGPTLRAVATPGTPRPCSMPQTPLGFALQSFPLSESRAAFRRPLLPCEFGCRPLIRHESPGDLRSVSPASPPRAEVAPSRARHRQKKGDASSPDRHVRPPRPARELPRTPTLNDRPEPSGIAGTRPRRPLRSLAPSENPFSRTTAPLAEACASELAPLRAAIVRAGALLGLCPSRAFPTTTSGSVDCELRPGRTGRLSEDHAPLR